MLNALLSVAATVCVAAFAISSSITFFRSRRFSLCVTEGERERDWSRRKAITNHEMKEKRKKQEIEEDWIQIAAATATMAMQQRQQQNGKIITEFELLTEISAFFLSFVHS